MDFTATSCFAEQDLDELLFDGESDQIMNTIEELAAVLGDDWQITPSTPPESVDSALTGKRSPSPNAVETHERLHKQRKVESVHGKLDQTDLSSSSSPVILSFGNPNDYSCSFPRKGEEKILENRNPEIPKEMAAVDSRKTINGRASKLPANTYGHIMAERKRRQLHSQQFQDLSTIVPGLKKRILADGIEPGSPISSPKTPSITQGFPPCFMDKTSVLGDTIKYLRELQERVKSLEEQASKQTIKSKVYVRRSQTLMEEEGSSYDEDSSRVDLEHSLPEIETRVSDGHILLRIYCEKQIGVLTHIFSEVEKFNLSVTNTSVSHFGSLALDITIIAQMEKEKDLAMKELVKGLRSALQHVTRTAGN